MWSLKQFQKNNKRKSHSRDNSRDKSKSKEKKGGFYFKQKSVFLTYSHTEKTGIQKIELGNYLFETFNCAVTVVCLEHHKDNNPHLHVWLEFKEVLYTRNVKIFDFKNHHPNIGSMRDKFKSSRQNALDYMMKEDKELP